MRKQIKNTLYVFMWSVVVVDYSNANKMPNLIFFYIINGDVIRHVIRLFRHKQSVCSLACRLTCRIPTSMQSTTKLHFYYKYFTSDF